jgi:hypothetical protein
MQSKLVVLLRTVRKLNTSHARFEILTMVNYEAFAASVIRVEHSLKMEAVGSSKTLVSFYQSTYSIIAQVS